MLFLQIPQQIYFQQFMGKQEFIYLAFLGFTNVYSYFFSICDNLEMLLGSKQREAIVIRQQYQKTR